MADLLWRGRRGEYSGYSVSGAANVNSDSYDDVIIGADGFLTDGDSGKGAVW